MRNFTAYLITFVAIFAISSPANAYLDPGSGSLLLQLLLGGVAGMITIAKLYWFQIKAYFTKSSVSNSEACPHPDDENKQDNT